MLPTDRPRLYLHVGLPKSGTTSLQELLRHHRSTLKENGYCYPDAGQSGHFRAAIEVTEKSERWGHSAESVAGSFDALVRQGHNQGGHVVISHEIFGQARPEHIPAILAAVEGYELHLVITIRDLGRVVPAAWQEWVKNGKRGTFDDFVDLKAGKLPGIAEPGVLFWRLQNVVEVLDRWAPHVPVDRVHIVPCPPSSAPRDELWRRFADAIGFPAEIVDTQAVPRANESISAPKVTFLRQVNIALAGRLVEPHGDRLRKHWLAQKLLSVSEGHKARSPRETVELFAPVSRDWADTIADRGHPVHGDLADIVPTMPTSEVRHPDSSSAEEQLEGLPAVVAEMLLRVRELEERAEVAEAEVDRLTAAAEATVPRVLVARAKGIVSGVRRRLPGRPSAQG